MASDCIYEWLILLEVFKKMDLGPLMVAVQILGQKASYLRAIMSYTGKWHIEDENLKDLLNRIRAVVFNVDLEFRVLLSDYRKTNEGGYWCMPMYLDNFLSSVLERLELLEPQIQQVYVILSKYSSLSRSISCFTDEAVMEYLQYLLENMNDLLKCRAGSMAPVKNEVEAVQKSLRFLRNFLGFTAKGCSELRELTDILIHAEVVADNIACLIYLCCVNDKMDDQMISWMKLELLSQMKNISPAQLETRMIYVNTIKASKSATSTAKAADFVLGLIDSLRENLLELSENKLRFSFPVDDLDEELRFLECLALDSPFEKLTDHEQKLKELCERNAALIKETTSFIYSFYDENEGTASERNFLVSDLLAKIKIAKEDARQIYDKLVPKSLRSNFPRTNAQGFISSLLRNVKQLLSSKADSVAPLKHHIEAVLQELRSLREDLSKNTKQASKQEVDDQRTRFKDVAYQTEYVIDSFLVKDGAVWFHKLGLFDIIEEIKTIRAGLKHLRRKVTDESTMLQKISSFRSQIPLQTSPRDEFVVFGSESEKIKEQLTHGSEKLEIVSIVGMPGVGKTTLTNSVFQHCLGTYHFHVCAKSCVGQVYDNKRLLRDILEEINGRTLQFSDEDLDHRLCQSLRGSRYLIFLDDIWDFELLGNMGLCFPDDRKGSRIIVTSRFDNIAPRAGAESVAYHLSPLSNEQSWELLRFKLFGKERCPQEIVEIGEKIAVSCSGLPLAIDLIAGVLGERERTQEFWQQLAQSHLLTELVDGVQARCQKVLEISYHHLPYHLRPCFLYFAGFPKDTVIPARRLECLWITEGFVQLPENDERNLEDVAKSYMAELISRNLIMVCERGSSNRVAKTCNIHDLLHDFVTAKATEERFLLPIDGLSDFSTLSSYGYPWFEQYRLFVSADCGKQFTFSNPSGPRIRSLVFSRFLYNFLDDSFYDCPINFSNFRLLRVFHVPAINIEHISPSILQLNHLRFLAIFSCEYIIFSAILQNMQNLETLIITRLDGSKNLSLTDIENMAKLRFFRHLSLPVFSCPRISQEISQKPFRFDNLQHLSCPEIYFGDEKLLKSMPNLRKLKCILGSSGNLNSCLKLDFLKNLESLSISSRSKISFLIFPLYLKKLTLSHIYLSWTNISELGKLEHLEVLKFQFLKHSTGIWDMVEFNKQFPKLKFLQLSYLGIEQWNASADDLPFLEWLQVEYCEYLLELPSCLAEILTLLEIRLTRCRKSAAISAKKIKEEQAEHGNEQLLVNIRDIIDEDAPRTKRTYYEEGLSVLKDFETDSNERPYSDIVLLGVMNQGMQILDQTRQKLAQGPAGTPALNCLRILVL